MFSISTIPKSRIATFDVYRVAKSKHHVAALLEFDVTEVRSELQKRRRLGETITLNAWIVAAIAKAVAKHPETAAFKIGNRKLKSFDDVKISFMIEKNINAKRVPFPMIIEKAQTKSAHDIAIEIDKGVNKIDANDLIVVGRTTDFWERLYYYLPDCFRRFVWKCILNMPNFAYEKMGNVSITSLGASGNADGWFIHSSIHPIAFGIGAVVKKPVVYNNTIQIRQMLNMTVLLDHDLLDGAPMVRFIKCLKNEITTYNTDVK